MATKDYKKKDYQQLLKLASGKLTMGVHAEEDVPYPDEPDMTTAQVGAIHEAGLGVPRRSWLQNWVDSDEFQQAFKAGLKYAQARKGGAPSKDYLDKLAATLQESMVARVKAGDIPPPNAPSTIKRKGHGRTLIDTELFVNSIRVKIAGRTSQQQKPAAAGTPAKKPRAPRAKKTTE